MQMLLTYTLPDKEEIAVGFGNSAVVALMHSADGSNPNDGDSLVQIVLSVAAAAGRDREPSTRGP
jgi:hypothetical protein